MSFIKNPHIKICFMDPRTLGDDYKGKGKRPAVSTDDVHESRIKRRLILDPELYNRQPEVVQIAYATKVQLDVEYGPIDGVAIFNVKSRLFSPTFAVAYSLHHTLGHWDFKIADHKIKDLVLVKFKNQSSISLVHGCNLKLGECTEVEALMMVTKVSELMPRTPELYTLTRTIILPVPRHPFDDKDDGASGGSGDAGAMAAA